MSASVENPCAEDRLLTFEVAGDLYAIPIAGVLEVADAARVTCIPTLPTSMGGVINYHGDALPVLNCSSLFEVNPTHMVLISSAFVASWLVGYLSFITPGGLGVREGALVILLTGILGPGEAGFLALVSRFLWMLAETGCSAIIMLAPSTRNK